MSRHRANQDLPYAKGLCFCHYTADTAVIGPSVAALNQRAQVGQDPLDYLGRQGTPLPLLESQLSGVRLVQLEHLLHLGGEALGVDLQVYLVVPQKAVTVYVRRTDRGPDAVYGGGLGVDHDVPVAEDPHPGREQLVVVAPAEPVGRDVVGVLGQEDLDVYTPGRRVGEARAHGPVRYEVGVGEVDVRGGPVYGLEVHRPDREDPHKGIVAVEDDARFPGAPSGGIQLRELGRAVGVPEVHEVVLDLAGRQPADLDVRVAPARGVERADVVAAEE